MKQLHKCPKCGAYGFSKTCDCGTERTVSAPPKYSPHDKYAVMKRKAKKDEGYFTTLLARFKRS